MKIAIQDYNGKLKEVTFDVENLEIAIVHVISGDETLKLFYRDGSDLYFDASESRLEDIDEGFEIVYSPGLGINRLGEFESRLKEHSSAPSESELK